MDKTARRTLQPVRANAERSARSAAGIFCNKIIILYYIGGNELREKREENKRRQVYRPWYSWCTARGCTAPHKPLRFIDRQTRAPPPSRPDTPPRHPAFTPPLARRGFHRSLTQSVRVSVPLVCRRPSVNDRENFRLRTPIIILYTESVHVYISTFSCFVACRPSAYSRVSNVVILLIYLPIFVTAILIFYE